MVSLVLVSHSRPLVEAVVGLVRQVASPSVQIAVAAGIGDERQEYGTDAIEICEAIQSVDSADGVLVMMDLGSAILSAEMALDFLTEDVRAHVRLCPAPLIEGAISAAIAAGLGTDIEGVAAEATGALAPKQVHLGAGTVESISRNDLPQPGDAIPQTVTLILPNANGLHVRPAAQFVQTVGRYDADVKVQKAGAGNKAVSGTSLNKLATLGAVQGDAIWIMAHGKQARQVLEALRQLVESGFGESPSTRTTAASPLNATPSDLHPPSNDQRAIPVSDGIAIGTLRRVRAATTTLPIVHTVISPEQEWQRLEQAISQTALAIDARSVRLTAIAGEQPGGIFNAHRLILADDALLTCAHQGVFTKGMNAESGWKTAIDALAQDYRSLTDPYQRQRAIDVEDVGLQVLAVLTGNPNDLSAELAEPSILCGNEFTPTQVAQYDPVSVLGLISGAGSATSHAAILARSLGIPAIAGASALISNVPDGTLIGLDGANGQLWINPANDVVKQLTTQRTTWLAQRERLRQSSQLITTTHDGHRIEIAANLSGYADARVAVANGAEAVGVLRTEFLYLTRTVAPTEDEQVTTLQQIAAVMEGRAVIVRTLDIGGDKSIPYLTLPMEANPFLGIRAIRLSLIHPDLFITQLRAILRAGVGNHLRILLPMITLVEEIAQTRQLIEEAHDALLAEGIAHAWPMQVGIMVETPAAALIAPVLAPMVDFFSIGTNDLTQYTLAAERGNPNLGHLSDALHPAVLRLIHEVVSAAHQNGKWAGVCGEVAADPTAIPILIGLGVDELSMNVHEIPQAKAIVRRLNLPKATLLAQGALQTGTAQAVRELVRASSTGSGG
jgi:phosphoenolpyruvate-protein phosphotransferase/dihydroxyacetone kinase phosphotransfer subunit